MSGKPIGAPKRFDRSAAVADVVAVLEADGAVIVERLFSDDLVAAINHEVDARLAAADPAMKHLNPALQFFFGNRTKHVSGLAAVSRTFATEVMIHPLYLGVCDAIEMQGGYLGALNLRDPVQRLESGELR